MLMRRLLVLLAVLLLLMTVATALAPRPESPLPPAGTSPLPAGQDLTKRISAADGEDTRVAVRRGDLLTLEVESDDLVDAVLLERLDRIDAIQPYTPARFTRLVEAPAGIYPIRLLEADRRIGLIEISD